MAPSRSPLEPIAAIVRLLLVLTVLGVVATLVSTLLGHGSLFGFGNAFVSVDVTTVGGSIDHTGYLTPRADAFVNYRGLRFFVNDPDLGQRLWFTLIKLSDAVVFVGVVLMAYRIVLGAERHGIYTSATVARLRSLSVFLAIGGLAAMVIKLVASNRLLATMVTEPVGLAVIGVDVPWTLLLTSAGLATLTRILRIGVEMREDLHGTV